MAQINIKKTDTLQTPTSGLAGVGVKQSNELFIVDENGQEIPVGGGLYGTQYVFVTANGTDTENATELQSAYDTAKTMSPSATNRITVVAGIGNYNFESSSFDMDTEYIDLVSLDGNRSVIFNASLNTSNRTEGSINMTANNVFVKGVDVVDKNFTIGDNLNLLKVENCKGGEYSFGSDLTFGKNAIIVSGTFTNCVGGDYSFGRYGTASGTFNNCVGGNDSFADFGTVSGTFTNCVGGDDSFGDYGTASGTFTNCVGGDYAFGSDGTASGTFTNCQGDYVSFGGYVTASGIFTDCQGGNDSFGSYGLASGTFTNCQGGNDSFGSYGLASGIFSNCEANSISFGGSGTASGTFTNCIGGNASFGGTKSGTLNGKLYYCRITLGTFQTVSSGGVTRLCIDGNNNENNQG